MVRRIQSIDTLQIPDKIQKVLILDNRYNQGLVILRSYLIFNKTNIYYFLNGYIQKDRIISNNKLQICNITILVILSNNIKLILILNQFLINECLEQTESLFNPYQAKTHRVRIDETTVNEIYVNRTPGQQKLVIENNDLPMFFNGFKLYFSITKPIYQEFNDLPRLELISLLPYDP